MQVNKCVSIEYTNRNGETKIRDVIPTYIPNPNIKAIDVDHLSAAERATLISNLEDYEAYRQLQLKGIFSFADWLDHTGSGLAGSSLKWRSFATDKINEK